MKRVRKGQAWVVLRRDMDEGLPVDEERDIEAVRFALSAIGLSSVTRAEPSGPTARPARTAAARAAARRAWVETGSAARGLGSSIPCLGSRNKKPLAAGGRPGVKGGDDLSSYAALPWRRPAKGEPVNQKSR